MSIFIFDFAKIKTHPDGSFISSTYTTDFCVCSNLLRFKITKLTYVNTSILISNNLRKRKTSFCSMMSVTCGYLPICCLVSRHAIKFTSLFFCLLFLYFCLLHMHSYTITDYRLQIKTTEAHILWHNLPKFPCVTDFP